MANDFIFRLKHNTKRSYDIYTLSGLYRIISVDHLLPPWICYYLTKYTCKWPVWGCAEPPACAPGEKPVTGEVYMYVTIGFIKIGITCMYRDLPLIHIKHSFKI